MDGIQGEIVVAASTDSICIIGFPKSGTIWLTRLTCDALRGWRAPGMPGGEQHAARSNAMRGIQPGDGPAIRHTHLLPSRLAEYLGEDVTKGIYIYRDFRDVLVSGFFFRHSADHETLLARHQRTSLPELLLAPWATLKQQYWRRMSRRAFGDFVARVCLEGWTPFGTWNEHYRQWREYAAADPCRDIAFVSYEQLKKDTLGTLERAFGVLKVDQPPRNMLAAVIARHSAERMRGLPRFEDAVAAVPGGFHRGTLRKGIVGDHRNYLTRSEARLVQRTHGPLLRELGYVNDPDWVNAF